MQNKSILILFMFLNLNFLQSQVLTTSPLSYYGMGKMSIETNPIYQATKETWLISEWKLPQIKYVLSEYRGLIVEVFEVGWISCLTC